VPKAWRKAGF